MTKTLKLPKFPIKRSYSPDWHGNESPYKAYNSEEVEKWCEQAVKVIEKQIKKDKKRMGGGLAYYMDVRPILESLKSHDK